MNDEMQPVKCPVTIFPRTPTVAMPTWLSVLMESLPNTFSPIGLRVEPRGLLFVPEQLAEQPEANGVIIHALRNDEIARWHERGYACVLVRSRPEYAASVKIVLPCNRAYTIARAVVAKSPEEKGWYEIFVPPDYSGTQLRCPFADHDGATPCGCRIIHQRDILHAEQYLSDLSRYEVRP